MRRTLIAFGLALLRSPSLRGQGLPLEPRLQAPVLEGTILFWSSHMRGLEGRPSISSRRLLAPALHLEWSVRWILMALVGSQKERGQSELNAQSLILIPEGRGVRLIQAMTRR